MIGDKATAKMLNEHYSRKPTTRWGVSHMRAPNGFRKIGEGAFKVAVRETATGLVYKVPKGEDMEDQHMEYLNSLSIGRRVSSVKRLGFEVRVPKTSRYIFDGGDRVILAQEYVDARNTRCDYEPYFFVDDETVCTCKRAAGFCFGEAREAIAYWSGLEDVHSANILIDKNKVMWIVDIGG